jgi:hypothetical protein
MAPENLAADIETIRNFSWLYRNIYSLLLSAASVVKWSEFLATDPEVSSSIPGAIRFSEK